MRSHPGTGWFVGLVVTLLIAVGWPRLDERVRATRRTRVWRPADAGFTLLVPPGWIEWSESRRDGATVLVRDGSDPLAGAVTFRQEPDFSAGADGLWFEAWAASARRARGRKLLALERGDVLGRPALRSEWSGRDPLSGAPLHGLELVCDRGAATLLLEVRARERDWAAVRADAAALLASLSLAPH